VVFSSEIILKNLATKPIANFLRLKHQKGGLTLENVNKAILKHVAPFVLVDLTKTTTEKFGNLTRPKRVARKKLDTVDEILLDEIYNEEFLWTNYQLDELQCKLQVTRDIWTKMLVEATGAVGDFERNRRVS